MYVMWRLVGLEELTPSGGLLVHLLMFMSIILIANHSKLSITV